MTRSVVVALLGLSLFASSVSAAMMEAPAGTGEPAMDPQDLAAQANQLAASIRAEIGDRVNTASVADLEGFIIFVVDQGTYPDEVVDTALATLEQDATGNFAEAIKNARNALKKKRRGTGAITDGGLIGGGGANGGGGDIPAPGAGTGGGETNYTA